MLPQFFQPRRPGTRNAMGEPILHDGFSSFPDQHHQDKGAHNSSSNNGCQNTENDFLM